jgi:hypothetical protein
MADIIGVANLIVSTVTAIAATYIALTALKHSAKPCITVVWQRPSPGTLDAGSGDDDWFIFDVINLGHWYAKPPAHDIVAEFRDDHPVFTRMELFKGGVGGPSQAFDTASSSPGPALVLRSLPFTLYAGEQAKFGVKVEWFKRMSGGGSIVVKAHSANGATYFHNFGFSFEQ